jgi:ABC-2 type transport system permease protein
MLAITIVMAGAQLAIDAAMGLSIDTGHLLSTIVLCCLLGLLHGSVAVTIAGVRGRPSLVVGLGIAIALGGYVIAALFPLSSVLAPLRHLSPWDWALAGNPLEQATELWRYGALAAPSILLTAIGVLAVGRRDIAAA